MNGWQVAGLVGALMLVDVVVISGLVYMFRTEVWGKIASAFAIDPPPDDEGRIAWSMKIDMWNAGGTFRVTADEEYLYLTPAVFGVWMKLQAVAIPWGSIEVRKVTRSRATLRVGRQDLTIPIKRLGGVLGGGE